MENRLIKLLFVFSIILVAIGYYYHVSSHVSAPVSLSPKKAIVIGASSGIGRALVRVLAAHGYQVGITARRVELLEQLAQELPTKSFIKQIDVSNADEAMSQLQELMQEMEHVDLIIINAGVGYMDADQYWLKQKQMIDVNVYGFTAMANGAINYFVTRKQGHLVGISSIAALRGNAHAYTYCGTKVYISTFLEGLASAMKIRRLPICVTDIKPGFVDTDLAKGVIGKFWEASPEEAAQQIYDAIEAKKEHAYVTKRWCLVAWFMKLAPAWLLNMVDRYEPK